MNRRHSDLPAVKPLLKWAGGKRQLLGDILKSLPPGFPDASVGRGVSGSSYFEPFLGGGALLFHLTPQQGTVSDINPELINFYTVLRDDPSGLLAVLDTLSVDSETFYRIRGWDREENWSARSAAEKAARLLYLNRTCFNGLFRVNRKGQFNVPFGRYRNPRVINRELILTVSEYLRGSRIRLALQDFEVTMEQAQEGDFVYLDPPYDPINSSSSFTGYTSGGFGREEQLRLRDACRRLDERGVSFLVSNSATPFILDLYSGFNIRIVQASRNINSRGSGRGKIPEMLARNYPAE